MISGTPIVCSYMLCLPRSPWLPTAKPWSLEKTTIVFSDWPESSKAFTMRPICASMCVMTA